MPTAEMLCSRCVRVIRTRRSRSARRCMPMTSSARRWATTKRRRLSSLASTALMPWGRATRAPISSSRRASQAGPRGRRPGTGPGPCCARRGGSSEHRHLAADAPEALAQQTEGAPVLLPVVQSQDLPDLPEGRGVDAVRQQAGVAVGARVGAVAGRDGAQETLRRAVAAGDGVGARREEAAVVVGAAGERLAPGRPPQGSMPWRSAIASICSRVSDAAMARRRPFSGSCARRCGPRAR